MSSWVSHLATPPAELVVLGLNQQELDANPMATERVVQDLNADPSLPFGDAEFDAVLCCVSIDYLTRPVEVLAEAARVLRPGAPVVITFSTGASRPRPSTAGWPPTTPDAQPSSPATCETPAASTSRSCPSVRRGAAIAVIRCTPWWRAQSPPEQHMS
jgi:SAM-dependent methyltransferase